MSRAMSNDFLGLIYFRRENEMDGESRYLKKKNLWRLDYAEASQAAKGRASFH